MNNSILKHVIVLIIILIVIFIVLLFLSHQCPTIPETNVTYNQIKDQINTGDIILLNGNSIIRSNLIRAFTASNLTHAGILLKGVYDDSGKPGIFMLDISPFRSPPVQVKSISYVFESSPNNTHCYIPLGNTGFNITLDDIKQFQNDIEYNYNLLGLYEASETSMICSSFIAYIHHSKGFNPQSGARSDNWRSKAINEYASDSRRQFFTV
jgi:hypothetical protein